MCDGKLAGNQDSRQQHACCSCTTAEQCTTEWQTAMPSEDVLTYLSTDFLKGKRFAISRHVPIVYDLSEMLTNIGITNSVHYHNPRHSSYIVGNP